MKLKEGVKVHGICPELMLGLSVANDVYLQHNLEMTITSLLDGRHSHTSLHYAGAAADLRTRDIPRDIDKHALTAEIKQSLGRDYDVILEETHIHIEYQPRRPEDS